MREMVQNGVKATRQGGSLHGHSKVLAVLLLDAQAARRPLVQGGAPTLSLRWSLSTGGSRRSCNQPVLRKYASLTPPPPMPIHNSVEYYTQARTQRVLFRKICTGFIYLGAPSVTVVEEECRSARTALGLTLLGPQSRFRRNLHSI